jgi:hypothetical protein
MVVSPVGLGTRNHCAGEGQQQFSSQLADWLHFELSQKAKTKAPHTGRGLPADLDRTGISYPLPAKKTSSSGERMAGRE